MSIIFEKALTDAEAADIIKNHPEQARFVQYDPDDGQARYARGLSEEAAVRIVKERPYNFRYMKNPTVALCEAAMFSDPWGNREFIPDSMVRGGLPKSLKRGHTLANAAKEECIEAVREDPGRLHHICWPWDDSELSAVDIVEIYAEAAIRDRYFGHRMDIGRCVEDGVRFLSLTYGRMCWDDCIGKRHLYRDLENPYRDIALQAVERNEARRNDPEAFRAAVLADARRMYQEEEREMERRMAEWARQQASADKAAAKSAPKSRPRM